MTSFEPYRPDDRYGSEPDRFLGEMQQLGMVAEADDDARLDQRDLGVEPKRVDVRNEDKQRRRPHRLGQAEFRRRLERV